MYINYSDEQVSLNKGKLRKKYKVHITMSYIIDYFRLEVYITKLTTLRAKSYEQNSELTFLLCNCFVLLGIFILLLLCH